MLIRCKCKPMNIPLVQLSFIMLKPRTLNQLTKFFLARNMNIAVLAVKTPPLSGSNINCKFSPFGGLFLIKPEQERKTLTYR